MADGTNRKEETFNNSQVGLLYRCFVGSFVPIDHIKPTPEGYLIYLEGNDITNGLRVIIEEEFMSVGFF